MKKYSMVGMVLVVLLLGVSTAVATAVATAAATDTVTRTLPETVSPGDTVTVRLTINFDDQSAVDRFVITETVPAGWEIVDASNNGRLAASGKVSWIVLGMFGGTIPADGAVFTYNVTVPSNASGTYPFSGIYGTNTAGTNLNVLGDANLTMGAVDIITRTLPETVFPGDNATVSLAIDFGNQSAVYMFVIAETVPAGWEIVDASNCGILTRSGKVLWIIIGMLGDTIPADGAVFTYNVTVPSDASGTYPFSGVYGTNTAGTNLDILGDANLTIDTHDPPTLETYTITNRTIAPPQTTDIDVRFSEKVSATIKIEDTVGNLIKRLYSSSGVTNPSPKHWDGTYTNGTTVPDGTYIVNVTGVSTTTGLSVINTSEAITVNTNME